MVLPKYIVFKMPKRSNPWTDGPQQMKTHIGQMEVAHGVAGEEILEKIHENTRKLLSEGAKQFYNGNICNEEGCMVMVDAALNNNVCRSGKQKDIASYFGGKAMSNKEILDVHINNVPRCRACQSSDVVVQCTFCDGCSCINCLRTCFDCGQDFCALCAIVSYDGPISKAFCLHCVK